MLIPTTTGTCDRSAKMMPITIHNYTSSAAQGGGGSFKNWKPIGVVVVNHGWQSESTDGPRGGWSCLFWSGCNVCSGHSPQLLDVVSCGAVAIVIVVVV